MPEKIPYILVFLYSLLSAGNFSPPPVLPDQAPAFSAWALTANDGFGHNYGVDEDNLRTFGLNLGALYKDRYLAMLDLSVLTDRNLTDSLSKRIDEMTCRIGYRPVRVRRPLITVTATGGLGIIAYGNFGSYDIQTGAHDLGDEETRPVPRQYTAPSTHGLAYLYTELFFPSYSTGVMLYSHGTSSLDNITRLALNYWAIKPMMQINWKLAYEYDNVAHAGSAAENIYKAETGPWLSSKVLIGPLVLDRGFNLNNLNQSSYVGFRHGGTIVQRAGPTQNYRMSYSIGWPIGHNSWIEYFRFHPITDAPRLALFLRTYHTENFYRNTITGNSDDRRIRRIKETSAGTEWYVQNPDNYQLINGFAFCGAGFDREMVTTYDVFEARFLELKTVPMVHAGGGVRISVPDLIYKTPGRFLGAEIRVNFRRGFSSTNIYTNPDMLLSWGLIFSER